MPHNLIDSYKSSVRLSFKENALNDKFSDYIRTRGKSSSVFAFLILGVISLAFAYTEIYALAINDYTAFQLFIFSSVVSFVNLAISIVKAPAPFIRLRLLSSAALLLGVIIYTIISVKYRPYYAMELIILIVWFSLFSTLKIRLSLLGNLIIIASFTIAMQYSGISSINVILITCYLFTAALLGLVISYLWDRMQCMLFMTTEVMNDISIRQEVWAYTLIDLDMALSGIHDFKDLLTHILEYLETVIAFESSVITSLEGQGPKPIPIKVQGELFENEDKTIWGEDLVSKLEQTRQAYNSEFYTLKKGFLGKKVKEFKHFRLDIPVFNEFNLVGIISLRRASKPFDDFDMIASVSIVSQAMMFFGRSAHTQNPVIKSANLVTKVPKELSTDATDLEMTNDSTNINKEFLESTPDLNVVPKDIQDSLLKRNLSSKKSLVILSRENADKISVDSYRTALLNGNPISIIILEIDGLSSIREKDGDKVAYYVFSGVAKQLFTRLDKSKQIVGRYGKNGMSILMPNIDMNAAEKFAETFRQFIEGEVYKTVYGTRNATLSIGIASITDDTGNYADMALFIAKKNGRNCVKVRL